MGRPRESHGGVVDSKLGVVYDCPACFARTHGAHATHTRHDAPPLLCKYYRYGPAKWSCEGFLRVRPATYPDHTLEDGCRFADAGIEVARRRKNELGDHAKAGPCRDPAIPAGGVVGASLASDDIGLDTYVFAVYDKALEEQGALGIFRIWQSCHGGGEIR